MSEKNPTIVNALDFDDQKLEALYFARFFGLLQGHPQVDSLADGGAQAIRSFGRDQAVKIFSGEMNFELSASELSFMESIVAQVLADIDKYRAEFEKVIAVNKSFQ